MTPSLSGYGIRRTNGVKCSTIFDSKMIRFVCTFNGLPMTGLGICVFVWVFNPPVGCSSASSNFSSLSEGWWFPWSSYFCESPTKSRLCRSEFTPPARVSQGPRDGDVDGERKVFILVLVFLTGRGYWMLLAFIVMHIEGVAKASLVVHLKESGTKGRLMSFSLRCGAVSCTFWILYLFF